MKNLKLKHFLNFVALLLLLTSCQGTKSLKPFGVDQNQDTFEIKAMATASYLENIDNGNTRKPASLAAPSRKPASLASTCRNLLRNVGGLFDQNSRSNPIFELAESEGEQLVKGYDELIDGRDMFQFWRDTRRHADDVTNITKKYLQQPIESTSDKRVSYISRTQANRVYRAVDDHPIASQCHLRRYDPQGNIGFCFGRAMTAHLELLNSGVQKDKIRKLWAVGSFKTGSSSWRYHVTTIVQGPDGSWWAIDPVMGSPVTAERWISMMKGYDVGGDMVAFTSAAKRFGPSSPDKYNRVELNNSGYNNYFNELLKSFRDNNGPFNGEVFQPVTTGLIDVLYQPDFLFKVGFTDVTFFDLSLSN